MAGGDADKERMTQPNSRSPRHVRVPRASVFVMLAMLFVVRCAGCNERFIHPKAKEHHDVAIQYLNQGQCLEAEERCRLALEYGDEFEHPHNCLGMIELICRNDLEKAKQHFKDALSVNPDFAEAHINLGNTFFRQNPPDYPTACDEYQAALEIDPANLDGRENLGLCYMRRGTIAGEKENEPARDEFYGLARSQLIRLLELNPNNFNARHHLGFMDMVQQKFESAEQNFRRCLEIDAENPVCSYNLGYTYLVTARCEEAIQAFITTLRAGQTSEVAIGARNNLGSAYEQCAKKDGAIKTFLDKIKEDPGNPTNHYDLGGIYEEKGLLDRAVNEWENTVKLDPLYCPAYFELAMASNKNLDSDGTIRQCQGFVSCVTERSQNENVGRWDAKVEECKQIVRKLEME